MAITTGPLFSLDASGTVGKTVTYSKWKGRNYVRRRVVPLNPFEALQVAARNRIRCLANGVFWAHHTALKTTPPGVTDEINIRANTPEEFAWNGYLIQKGVGTNADTYTDMEAAWTDIGSSPQGAWNTAASILVPAMQPAPQGATGGGAATPLTAGKVFFAYRYALYAMGLRSIPDETPPTYA